jgi:hypothetical protein
VVVKKQQWMYSNYAQSARVVNVALLRAVYNVARQVGVCFYVHPPEPVYQAPSTSRVLWPTDVAKPPKAGPFAQVDPSKYGEPCETWFNAQVEAQKKEKAKQATGMDIDPDVSKKTPAPAPAPAATDPLPAGWVEKMCPKSGKPYYYQSAVPKSSQWARPTAAAPAPAPAPAATIAPLQQQQQLKLDEICAHVLNIASGAFDPAVPDPTMAMPLDLADARCTSLAAKLHALYTLGVAAADKSLERHQRRLLVNLHEEVHKCSMLHRWNHDKVLTAIGAVLGQLKENEVRTKCTQPSSMQLLSRVAFLNSKKQSFLDAKKVFLEAQMDPVDCPLAMQWIEAPWQALPDATKVTWKM